MSAVMPIEEWPNMAETTLRLAPPATDGRVSAVGVQSTGDGYADSAVIGSSSGTGAQDRLAG